MTRSVSDILAALERIAPAHKAADWDRVGLQLGDPARGVTSVAVCHELTQTLVDRVLVAKPSLVVTYHPLIFRPLASLTASPGPAGRVLQLAEAGIAVVAMHTNFDAASGGTADALAEAIGLSGAQPFGPAPGAASVKVVTFVPGEHVESVVAAMAGAGAGDIGTYRACAFTSEGVGRFTPGPGSTPAIGTVGEANRVQEVRVEMVAPKHREAAVVTALRSAHPYEEAAYDVYDVRGADGMIGRVGSIDPRPLARLGDDVALALGTQTRLAGDPEKTVASVAVVPGSGADFIAAAAAAGADVLVTGDVSHHRAREALERGLAIIDAGHGPTERPGVKALYASVRSIFENALDLTGVDDSPWEAM